MDKPIYVVNSKVADSLRELCGGSLPEGYIVSDELPKIPEYNMQGSNPNPPPGICRPDPPPAPPQPARPHKFVLGEDYGICEKCGITIFLGPKTKEAFERERKWVDKGCRFK